MLAQLDRLVGSSQRYARYTDRQCRPSRDDNHRRLAYPQPMSWNTHLFLLLNAAADPGPITRFFSGLLASAPVLLAPVLLTYLWIWGDPDRRPALLAVAGGLFVGQAFNVLLELAWYEPRPFMVGLGRTWMPHVADNGFPSDHATLAWSMGLGLILTNASRRWGRLGLCARHRSRLGTKLLGRALPGRRTGIRARRTRSGTSGATGGAGGANVDMPASRAPV